VATNRFHKAAYCLICRDIVTLHTLLLATPLWVSSSNRDTKFITQKAIESKTSIMEMSIIALACAVTLLVVFTFIWKYYYTTSANIPVSVNYHFTRRCNYQCGFCFYTAKTSYILPLEDAKKGLSLLKQAGMRKLNFAGGEPFLYPKFIGELAKYCKVDLDIESISIVTNGSLVKPNFFDLYGQYIDIMAISCDSFNEATNVKIGRGTGKHLHHL
jgi:radical S-adenosyl methionine domain-containing protein 2